MASHFLKSNVYRMQSETHKFHITPLDDEAQDFFITCFCTKTGKETCLSVTKKDGKYTWYSVDQTLVVQDIRDVVTHFIAAVEYTRERFHQAVLHGLLEATSGEMAPEQPGASTSNTLRLDSSTLKGAAKDNNSKSTDEKQNESEERERKLVHLITPTPNTSQEAVETLTLDANTNTKVAEAEEKQEESQLPLEHIPGLIIHIPTDRGISEDTSSSAIDSDKNKNAADRRESVSETFQVLAEASASTVVGSVGQDNEGSDDDDHSSSASEDEDIDIIPPLMTKLVYNYETGSTVRVVTHKNVEFEGQVFINPANTELKNSIKLVNIKSNTGKTLSHHTWCQNEIKTIIPVKPVVKFIGRPKEMVMSTVIVENIEKLSRVIKGILEVKEVGCYFPGLLKGRLSKPEMIILNVNNTLIVIPFKDPDLETTFWKEFGKKIFANPNVMKVFFNSHSASDYLFHVRGIRLEHLFDLKWIEKYLRDQQKVSTLSSTDSTQEKPSETIKLTDLLLTYLPNVIPECEYDLLNEFSQVDPRNRSESLIKFEKKYCALKVKYLVRLQAEMKNKLMEPISKSVIETHKRITRSNIVEFGVET